MRTLIILTLILAALLGLSTWGYYQLDNSARTLAGHLDKSEKAVAGRDWPTVGREISRMSARWERTKTVWTVFINHEEMDKIDMSMARLKEFMVTRNKTETRAGLAELKMLIRHIPEKEALTLHNIL